MIGFDELNNFFSTIYQTESKDETGFISQYGLERKIKDILRENKNLLFSAREFNEQTLKKIKDFDKNATNCFVVGRTQELEI